MIAQLMSRALAKPINIYTTGRALQISSDWLEHSITVGYSRLVLLLAVR